MIKSVVRQSIVIKCTLQESIMLGNYEFYYAMGLFSKIARQSYSIEKSAIELKEDAMANLNTFQTEDKREQYLIHLLKEYQPKDEKTNEMLELYEMGINEDNPWVEY